MGESPSKCHPIRSSPARARGAMLALALLLASLATVAATNRAVPGASIHPAAARPLRPRVPQPESPSRLAAAKLLIATERLFGPFFSETVVLLLDYSEHGAVGVIINRPTQIALSSLLPNLEKLAERADAVYAGGPVNPRSMAFLIRSAAAPPHAVRLHDEIYVSSSAETLRHVLAAKTPETHFRAYIGYAGWAPGQLDNEVARGDWYVAPAESKLIFETASKELWPKLIREYSGVQVRLTPTPRTEQRRGLVRHRPSAEGVLASR